MERRLLLTVFNVNSVSDILNPPAGTVTLRSAISAANASPGDNTINLTVAGTYAITLLGAAEDNNQSGDFDIIPNPSSPAGSTLLIQNTSGGKVFVDANHHDRVFDINPGGTSDPNTRMTVTMKGFVIENGDAFNGSSPDDLSSAGGGIRDQGNASLTLTNMTLTLNDASSDGGGLVMGNTTNSSWTLTVNNSTISSNHAGDAGGGIDTDGAGTVIINSGTVITANTDLNQGAGVYVDALQVGPTFVGANMTMTGTIVSNNAALATGVTGSGGGISNAGNGVMTISNSTIENNTTFGTGGGFSDENNQGTLVVSNSIFSGNVAAMDGGGIQEGGPTTSITNTEFKSNFTGTDGGALFVNGPTLTLSHSTLSDNTSSGNGGGIELETTGTGTANGSTITDTTITRNSALNNGGASGGGIDAPTTFTGSLSLLNDTITGNFATDGGGVFWNGTSGSIAVENTIISSNAAPNGNDANNISGTFTDNGGNLIGVSGTGSGNTGFTASSTLTGTVAHPLLPNLGSLQDNGGPTVGAPGTTLTLPTKAPQSKSPVIGKGLTTNAPTTDERGAPTVVGGKANIGAVSAAPADKDLAVISVNAITAKRAHAFSGKLARFSDADAKALPTDYSVSINWGDGKTSAGVVTVHSAGGFDISGTHSYAHSGSFAITITILDKKGRKDSGGSRVIANTDATVS